MQVAEGGEHQEFDIAFVAAMDQHVRDFISDELLHWQQLAGGRRLCGARVLFSTRRGAPGLFRS